MDELLVCIPHNHTLSMPMTFPLYHHLLFSYLLPKNRISGTIGDFTAEARRAQRIQGERKLYVPFSRSVLLCVLRVSAVVFIFCPTMPVIAFLLTLWLSGCPAFWLSLRPGDYSADLTSPHVVKTFRSGLTVERESGKPGSNSYTIEGIVRSTGPNDDPYHPPIS